MAQNLLGSSSPCHFMQEAPAYNHRLNEDAALMHKRSPTRLAALYKKRKSQPISPADGWGVLYAYLDNGVDFKVGMTSNFARRRREWDRQCPCPTRIWMDTLPVAHRRRAESLAHLLIEGICTDRPRKHCKEWRRMSEARQHVFSAASNQNYGHTAGGTTYHAVHEQFRADIHSIISLSLESIDDSPPEYDAGTGNVTGALGKS
ncbi:hypothetical protein F5880DRAFT_1657692 [Lentinula raphanica]|nr:hypothetical protein F5880DRAFT_1657692 [Lentinula raphanica]